MASLQPKCLFIALDRLGMEECRCSMYMYAKGKGKEISPCRFGRGQGTLTYPICNPCAEGKRPTVVKSRRAMMASVVGEVEGPALVNVAPL
jgi:hypothetical protein